MSQPATDKRDPEGREGAASLAGDSLVALKSLIPFKIKGQLPSAPSSPCIKEGFRMVFLGHVYAHTLTGKPHKTKCAVQLIICARAHKCVWRVLLVRVRVEAGNWLISSSTAPPLTL